MLTSVALLRILAPQPERLEAELERITGWLGPLEQAMAAADILRPPRMAAFLAQCAHESAEFNRLEENLRYSAAALLRVFRLHFPDAAIAERYAARGPEAIANRAYADRMGNGPEASGDGWSFRGRGLLHITGRKNYRLASMAIARDPDKLQRAPWLVISPEYACATAGWFWQSNGLNELADAGRFLEITRRINGGTNGLDARVRYWDRARKALRCT
jgi:putative chitinase